MYKVSWFWELLPWEKIIEDQILQIIDNSYKQLWYTKIETPAVEKNEVLLAKWWEESKNQIFGLYGLAQWVEDAKNYSLHFDLTVPFARYVLDNQNSLSFPFKRSQIQKVRRWERAQRWRFREFYQADADVIWDDRNSQKVQNIFYDAEILFLMKKTLDEIFTKFDISDKAILHINNKKLVLGFLEWLELNETNEQIMGVIDKKDKISKEEFTQELSKIWLNKEKINKIQEFINFDQEKITELEKYFEIKNENFNQWICEMEEIIDILNGLWLKWKYKIDFSIMRGLNYYTWTVFETFLEWDRKLGSVASGGRYEKLTSFIDEKSCFSGVWGSIGLSRLESYIFEKVKNKQQTSSDFLMIFFTENKEEIFKLYSKLLQEWKKIELYPQDEKIWKQFKYADKKWIPHCIVFGEDEKNKWIYQIKNMEDGTIWEIKI